MSEATHLIKRYTNGRLYDATEKKYVTMSDIEALADAGTGFRVVVSKTDEDITEEIVSKLSPEKPAEKEKGKKAKGGAKAAKTMDVSKAEEEEPEDETPFSSVIGGLLKKGGGLFSGVPRKSMDLWHSAMTMAEEEFDKRVRQLVKGKEISETEAKRLKDEILGFTGNLKSWLGENVEERINDVMSMMNLATRDQLDCLAEKIEALNEKLATLERMEKEGGDIPEGVAVEKPEKAPEDVSEEGVEEKPEEKAEE